MKRPAFQFYTGDWQKNAKLRRCSHAARGAWIDVLCLLHDSEEYGVLRWPLKDIAQAAGAPMALIRELVTKGVLKGADRGAEAYVYRPKHAGKEGDPVTLVQPGDGPCWFSSRFVRDEWVRQRRGNSTQFSQDNQPPKPQPKGGYGGPQGEGSSASSSSSGKPSVPDGTGASAPPDGLSAHDAIFQVAVPWLVANGCVEKSVRSLLGGAEKQLGEEGAWALASDCMRIKPIEPTAWLAAALNDRMGQRKGRPNKQEALERQNQAVAAQLAGETP